MPTQSRGFYSCDFCRQPFDTLDEAKEHESSSCPQRSGSFPPPGSSALAAQRYSFYPPFGHPPQPVFPPGESPGGGVFFPANTYTRGSPFAPQAAANNNNNNNMPPFERPPPTAMAAKQRGATNSILLLEPGEQSALSPVDALTCQNLELFSAGPDHAMEARRSAGVGPVVVGQLGLRCRQCALAAPTAASPYSMVFPGSLNSLAASVRRLAHEHLPICARLSPSDRQVFQQRKEQQQSEQDDPDQTRGLLVEYCFGFCNKLGIVNRHPPKTGICFAEKAGGGYPQYEAPYHPPPHAPMPPPHQGSPQAAAAGGGRIGPPHHPDPSARAWPGHAPMMQARGPRPGEDHVHPPYGWESSSVPYPEDTRETGVALTRAIPQQRALPSPEAASPTADSAGMVPFVDPMNFPFYQEHDRSWHCKFCSHVHPQYRDPNSIWTSPSGGPPPLNFVDQHLHMCQFYAQPPPPGPPPVMMGGPPPPPHMVAAYPGPPPSAWGESFGGGNSPHPTVDQPPYPPPHPAQFGEAFQGYPPPGVIVPGPFQKDSDGITESIQGAIRYLEARYIEHQAKLPPSAQMRRLVVEDDKLLLTDYFFNLMRQLQLTRFSEADRRTRGGKREKVRIGYGGLECVHCYGHQSPRKFYWSNVDRLANSFAEIPGHVLKCRRCPQPTKDALLHLKEIHSEQMARLPRGSQKVFFRRMWRRMHDEDPPEEEESPTAQNEQLSVDTGSPSKEGSGEHTPLKSGSDASPQDSMGKDDSPNTKDSDESRIVVQRTSLEAAQALAAANVHASEPLSPSNRVVLAVPDDKDWLSDMDCFVRKQIEVFSATDADVQVATSGGVYPVFTGQVGIRCIHCAIAAARGGSSESIADTVRYPFQMAGIVEAVREFQKVHLESGACPNLPASVRSKFRTLQPSSASLSSVLRKYYILAAQALGLQDTKDGIRAGGESKPIGAQAAFTFADDHMDVASPLEYKGRHPSSAKRKSPGSRVDDRSEGAEPHEKMARKHSEGAEV